VGYQPQQAPPPGPLYGYDYSRMPPNRGGGSSVVLIGGLAFMLILVLGVGAMFAFNIGPFARPSPTLIAQPSPTAAPLVTPSPKPSTTAAASATAAATSSGSPTATGSAGPTATPIPSGDVTDALLSHVPEPLVPTCTVTAGDSPILALATCSADDGNIALTYFQYDGYDSMFSAYEGFREASQIEPDTGDCQDHASWPTENGFNINGQLAGRWLCTEALGATSIYWTDNRLNILSVATQTNVDIARLVEFWVSDSGPNL
jgi:hypothetical protein